MKSKDFKISNTKRKPKATSILS